MFLLLELHHSTTGSFNLSAEQLDLLLRRLALGGLLAELVLHSLLGGSREGVLVFEALELRFESLHAGLSRLLRFLGGLKLRTKRADIGLGGVFGLLGGEQLGPESPNVGFGSLGGSHGFCRLLSRFLSRHELRAQSSHVRHSCVPRLLGRRKLSTQRIDHGDVDVGAVGLGDVILRSGGGCSCPGACRRFGGNSDRLVRLESLRISFHAVHFGVDLERGFRVIDSRLGDGFALDFGSGRLVTCSGVCGFLGVGVDHFLSRDFGLISGVGFSELSREVDRLLGSIDAGAGGGVWGVEGHRGVGLCLEVVGHGCVERAVAR